MLLAIYDRPTNRGDFRKRVPKWERSLVKAELTGQNEHRIELERCIGDRHARKTARRGTVSRSCRPWVRARARVFVVAQDGGTEVAGGLEKKHHARQQHRRSKSVEVALTLPGKRNTFELGVNLLLQSRK